MYKLDPAKKSFSSWISMQAALKKTKAKLDLLTGIGKLLMVEEDIRQGICHSIDMQKLIRDT